MIVLPEVWYRTDADRRRQMAAFDALPRQVREVIAYADRCVDAEAVLPLLYRFPPRELVAQLRQALNAGGRS